VAGQLKVDTPHRLLDRARQKRLIALGFKGGYIDPKAYARFLTRLAAVRKTKAYRALHAQEQIRYKTKLRQEFGPCDEQILLFRKRIATADKKRKQRKQEAQHAYRLLLQQKVQKANRRKRKASKRVTQIVKP